MIVGLGDIYDEDDGLGDPLIWWPSSIDSLATQVSNEVQAVAVYVSALRKESGALVMTDSLLSQFKDFYNEAKNYIAGLGVLDKLTGATVDRLKELQKRNLEWRTLIEQRASQYGSKTPAGPRLPAPGKNALDELFGKLSTAAKWGVGIGAALLAYKVATDTGLLKDVFRPTTR